MNEADCDNEMKAMPGRCFSGVFCSLVEPGNLSKQRAAAGGTYAGVCAENCLTLFRLESKPLQKGMTTSFGEVPRCSSDSVGIADRSANAVSKSVPLLRWIPSSGYGRIPGKLQEKIETLLGCAHWMRQFLQCLCGAERML
jgi:hypothetical protein